MHVAESYPILTETQLWSEAEDAVSRRIVRGGYFMMMVNGTEVDS